MTIRIRSAPTHLVRLLNPRPLKMAVVPIIVGIRTLDTDSGRTGISERGRLSLNAVPLIVIGDKGRLLKCLMVRGREHLVGNRNELVEGR